MNKEATNLVERVRFGTFELNVRTGELVSIGTESVEPESAKVLLREQPFRILRILVERQGQMVTRQEIRQILWPNDTFVDYERSINVAMAILRKALADDADHPKYIETLARRGYRLIVPVEWQESTAETPRLESLQTSTPLPANRNSGLIGTRIFRYRVLEILAIVALVLILVTAGALFWRHHSGIALSSTDTLVLADVTNQTSDGALDEGLNFALLVALEQSPYLNLLGGDKLHETARRLGLSEDTKITPLVTPQVALQVCRKTNSRAVVSASIKDIGNRFRIELSAIDCQSGKTLEQKVHEAERRDDIVRTLGLSASQLRASLDESKDSLRRFNQPLDQATSASPEALQFLTLGYEKQLSGDIPGALAYYARAIEKDQNFALAYAAEGSGNEWLNKDAAAVAGYSAAFELRNRLTIPSRFRVETAYYGTARKEWDKACRVGQEWVQAFPRDVIARINFSFCLANLGRHDEQLVQAREAARLLPSAPTLIRLLVAALSAQRIDEARETYDEAISRGVDSPGLHRYHAQLAFLQNDKSGMQKEWAWASQDPIRGRFVLYRESEAEGFYGRSRKAHRLVQMDVDSSMKAGLLSDAAGFESSDALRDAETGNLRQSQASVRDALRKSQDRNALMLAALTFARAGNTKQSQELVEKLNQLFPNDFTIQTFSLPTTRAAIKLDENDPAAAVEILRPVTPYDLVINDNFACVSPAYLRGLAYLQLKQGDLAAAEFRKVLDHSGVVQGFVTGALSILQLARAQVLMHDEEAARKSYEDFLALWKNADPDLPIYKQAKAEYAVLRKAAR
jgi:DNA-binding winged helix-turn-helix (wHTH) protein/tetratricopeptide (TPR) repeat protein